MWRVLERKNFGDLIVIPIDLAVVNKMAFVWGCRDRFWLIMTLMNFVLSTLTNFVIINAYWGHRSFPKCP